MQVAPPGRCLVVTDCTTPGKEQQHSGRSMMYWTFDEYRQDRQEILFGPYLTLPYLLPPTSYLTFLPRCRRMLSSSLQEICGCVQDCVTNLEEVHIHPLHVSSLVYLGDSTSTGTYFQQAISLYHLLIYQAEDCVFYRYLIDRYHYVYRCLGYGQESTV